MQRVPNPAADVEGIARAFGASPVEEPNFGVHVLPWVIDFGEDTDSRIGDFDHANAVRPSRSACGGRAMTGCESVEEGGFAASW